MLPTNFVTRKLLTKPIWLWQTRRSKPWLPRWRELPPVEARDNAATAVILGTVQTLDECAWAAWSLARYHPGLFTITVFVDGWTEADANWVSGLKQCVHGVHVEPVKPFLNAYFSDDSVFGPFLRRHPMANKLLLLLAKNESGPVLYLDNDVLFFQQSLPLVEAIKRQTGNYFIADIGEGSWDPQMLELIQRRNLPRAIPLNGGLQWAQSGVLDKALARSLLEEGWRQEEPVHWFTEQTVASALFGAASAEPLPSQSHLVSNSGQFYFEDVIPCSQLVCRHFTGPVRHLMYHQAYPYLFNESTPA